MTGVGPAPVMPPEPALPCRAREVGARFAILVGMTILPFRNSTPPPAPPVRVRWRERLRAALGRIDFASAMFGAGLAFGLVLGFGAAVVLVLALAAV